MIKLVQSTTWRDGLWTNNPGLIQLLGLCPLLAVTTTATNGLGLGLATMCVMLITNTVVSALRHQIPRDIRIPLFVLIIASTVTAVELLIHAYFFELGRTLGIFIPLIVTNCTILARAEAFASRQSVPSAMVDGLSQGLGFAWVLVCLGALRELIGTGTVFARADVLLGSWAQALELSVFPEGSGLLLALLPPGAFLLLGLLVALHQHLIRRQARRTQAINQDLRYGEPHEQNSA